MRLVTLVDLLEVLDFLNVLVVKLEQGAFVLLRSVHITFQLFNPLGELDNELERLRFAVPRGLRCLHFDAYPTIFRKVLAQVTGVLLGRSVRFVVSGVSWDSHADC